MAKSESIPGLTAVGPTPAGTVELGSIPSAANESDAPTAWSSASHEDLFVPGTLRCDACGCDLDDDLLQEGRDLPGRGVYVWTRGNEVRFEDAPLCAACASAIGMTALARWEIEEEEG